MNTDIQARGTVKATLNFAADRSNGGIWSNSDPHLITQQLTGHQVELHDARQLPDGPTLEGQGLTVIKMPVADPQWTNDAWVSTVYMPKCVELVRELTHADHVAQMMPGVLIRDTGDKNRAKAAEFVHFDNTRESLPMFLGMIVDQEIIDKYPRVMVFNIWRPLTPAPQNIPLAMCDSHSIDPQDWVEGVTIDREVPQGAPYATSVYNPDQHWWWVSDLNLDEVVVFKGYDNDPSAPFGCLHGAFKNPDCPAGAVPRASAETRVLAFYTA